MGANRAPENLAGRTFSRLTVVGQDGRTGRSIAWSCRCECGGAVRVIAAKLKNGNTRSCGCLKRDMLSARQRVHGHRGNDRRGIKRSPENRAWRGMIDRCENPASEFYSAYGGRGISVCAAWRASFSAFFADVGPRPSPKHSVDRINVDGGYEPGNVRWATAKEQGRNKRNNVIVTLGGHEMTRAEAAERIGWPYIKLRDRMRRWGTTNVDFAIRGAA